MEHHHGDWTVITATTQGTRRENEDATAVRFAVDVGGKRRHAFAIFDGVGGQPGGRLASKAAANALKGPFADRAELVDALNEAVLGTGGATTVALALVSADGARVDVLSAGDSSIYGPTGKLLNHHDLAGDSRITDHLGHERGPGTWSDDVGPAPLVLCTDGVDRLIEERLLQKGIGLAADPKAAAAFLMQAVADAGATDNATVLVAARVS